MTPIMIAFLLATAPVSPDARIAASAAEAQALQGPLDGTWILADASGRPLYIFQIVDPAGGGDLQAAWRVPGPVGEVGEATARRAGGRLGLTLGYRGPLVSLSRVSGDLWRGSLRQGGRSRRVLLRRR